MRALPEWIGASPNSRPPERVRLRVFLKHDGICHVSQRRIRPGEPWDLDHIVALINGGENRESNLAPILRDKAHKAKTKLDMAEKSHTYRKRKNTLGIRKPRSIRQWRKFDGTPVYAGRER